MSQKAFVYTELQISAPFNDVPWREISNTIKQQPGFLNKTWLSGVDNQSVGGLYSFDSIGNAEKFATEYFPTEPAKFNVGHTARIFDAVAVKEASVAMNSPHYGETLGTKPGAFVYTEVQINLPFDGAPWRERNPELRQQPGFLSKTWLSGLHTNTVGGLYAYESIETAKAFAINAFPQVARKMNKPIYTRIFDANVTEEASRYLHSPFYA